jgi:predicted unusual protein kinase regulating ubiquinone biosynthesis (AarF/ABC1/UbiB family)
MLFEVCRIRRLFLAIIREPYERRTFAQQLRLAFESLGPTYIKFGQMIASSEGLFPRAYSEEFRKCLDRVPPFASAEARAIVARELAGKAVTAFSQFDQDPIAAASIAQVHCAVLADGREVVIKIQRPHLERRVSADVRIMLLVARFLEWMSKRIRLSNLVGIVGDFAQTLTEELDFRMEGQSMDAFNELFQSRPGTRVCAPARVLGSGHQEVLDGALPRLARG